MTDEHGKPVKEMRGLYCTNCHNNDEWTPTGTRPRGPHGSRYEPILEMEFQRGDPVSESPASYALCYKCHNRSVVLSSTSFSGHNHAIGERASCSFCHDPHGISSAQGTVRSTKTRSLGPRPSMPLTHSRS